MRSDFSLNNIQVVVRAGVIKLLSITQTDRGNGPETVTEKLENVVDCLKKNLNAPFLWPMLIGSSSRVAHRKET